VSSSKNYGGRQRARPTQNAKSSAKRAGNPRLFAEQNGCSRKRRSFLGFLAQIRGACGCIRRFGYEIREFSPILASVSYLVALAILLRGALPWCNSRPRTTAIGVVFCAALLLLAWRDYKWVRDERTPTFLYLVPTRELIDCERRAFFVNHSGFKELRNVIIVIKDNRSGAVVENDDYKTGIEPGPQNPDAPRYIWVKPSHPWDEAYTITVTATKFDSGAV